MNCVQCRKIFWIDGPFNNASIQSFNIAEDSFLPAIHNTYPQDICLDPVNGIVFSLSITRSIFRISSDKIEVVFEPPQFDNQIPIAIDIFEIFLYVILESGTLAKINMQTNFVGK